MYNRLFTKILDSSIWLEPDATRIVWITLLAAMDEDGYAPFSSTENLSRRANVPLPAVKEALSILESPDKYNPDDEWQGRRIEKVHSGWLVLKAPHYRTLLSREIAREQNRLRVEKFRSKSKVMNESLPNITDITVTHQSRAKHSTSKAKKMGMNPPTLDMVIDFLKDDCEANKFWDYYQSNGWRVGKNPMKDWQASARRWKREAVERIKSHAPKLHPTPSAYYENMLDKQFRDSEERLKKEGVIK